MKCAYCEHEAVADVVVPGDGMKDVCMEHEAGAREAVVALCDKANQIDSVAYYEASEADSTDEQFVARLLEIVR